MSENLRESVNDSRAIYVASVTLDDPSACPPDEISFREEHIDWLEIGKIPHD